MESLRNIATGDSLMSAPSPSETQTRSLLRIEPLADSSVIMLRQLWEQTLKRYPQQEMLEMTADMWLAEWAEMMRRFSESLFVASLSKVIRRPGRGPFLPAPDEIREELEAAAQAEKLEQSAREHLRQLDDARAQWERERAEDTAAGITPAGSGERAVMTEAYLAVQERVRQRQAAPVPPPQTPAPPRIVDMTAAIARAQEIKAQLMAGAA